MDLVQMNTLVRIREKTLFSSQQKNSLLLAPDLASAIKLLSEWDFFSYADLPTSADFQQALLLEEQGWITWAKKLEGGTEIAEMFMLPNTIHNLKLLLKEFVTKKSFKNFYMENSLFNLERVENVFEKTAWESEIPAHWIEQACKVLEDYRQYHSLSIIDFRLDVFYYTELMDRAARLNDSDIEIIVEAMIDLYHLAIILQTRTKNEEISFLSIVRGGTLKNSIHGLLNQMPQEQDAFLLESSYASIWKKIVSDHHGALFDIYADQYLMTLCKKAKLQAFGTFPLYGFLFAKLRDIKNVRLVLNGKKYHLSEKELKERMCISYEL